jgi:hypothetical protein
MPRMVAVIMCPSVVCTFIAFCEGASAAPAVWPTVMGACTCAEPFW